MVDSAGEHPVEQGEISDARVQAASQGRVHPAPAEVERTQAESALVRVRDGRFLDRWSGLGGRLLPDAVEVPDSGNRRLEPGCRFRCTPARFRYVDEVAIKPSDQQEYPSTGFLTGVELQL